MHRACAVGVSTLACAKQVFYEGLCQDSFMGSEPAVALVLERASTREVLASVVAHRLSYSLPQVHTVMNVLSNSDEDTNIAYVMTLGVREDVRCVSERRVAVATLTR